MGELAAALGGHEDTRRSDPTSLRQTIRMADSNSSTSKGNGEPAADKTEDFFSMLLTPGSSLNPTFLLVLDVAFASLLVLFAALLYLTQGSIHFVVLMLITLGFWGSVKW